MGHVQIIHSTEDHSKEYVHAAINVALDIHTTQPPGAVFHRFLASSCYQRAPSLDFVDPIGSPAEGREPLKNRERECVCVACPVDQATSWSS